MCLKLNFKKLHSDAKVPTQGTAGSAGYDLYSLNYPEILTPRRATFVPTGIAVEIPEGYAGFILPRSGNAAKGIQVANSPGLIDSDYRGEIKILAYNATDRPIVVSGIRIAQLVILTTEKVEMVEVEELSRTDRGTGGFGHTGQK